MPSDNIVVTVDVPSWADTDFIASLLRHDEDDADLTIERCDLDGTTTVGDNYMSVLIRAAVEYRLSGEKASKKLRLIIKSLPPGELMQKWIVEIGAFDRELHMYTVTLPQLHALGKERVGAGWTPLAPRLLATERPDTVVLEDLTPHGFKMADRRQGLDFAHCRLALQSLARMHAASIALHEERPEVLEFYHEVFYIEKNRKMLTDFMETTFDSLAREVGTWPGYEHFEQAVKKISSTSVDRCIELVKVRPGSVRVLNHGDFWTNNMLFRYDNSGSRPVDHRIIDFQMGRFASPALDLYYFFYTSPHEHVLESSFDALIGEYHTALETALRDLHADTTVSLAQIQKELEDKQYFAVIMSCMFFIMVAEPENAPKLADLTEENLETVGVEAMSKAFAGDGFRLRFQRRLVMFEKLGVI